MSERVCDFGCGREAIKQLKNRRFLCAEFVAQCPEMRAKNNATRRGQDPFAGREHPRGMAGKIAWNYGRRYEETYDRETVQRVRAAAARGGRNAHIAQNISPEAEAERRRKLSVIAQARGLGGYERGSGRGKKGWYRGYWCDSTYELAFVAWAVDHEIPFERNLEGFPYEYEGRVLYWMPDFLLADGTYIEIKGYLTRQAEAKFESFLRPLRIFRRADLQPMFDYVHHTYGTNLLALYE